MATGEQLRRGKQVSKNFAVLQREQLISKKEGDGCIGYGGKSGERAKILKKNPWAAPPFKPLAEQKTYGGGSKEKENLGSPRRSHMVVCPGSTPNSENWHCGERKKARKKTGLWAVSAKNSQALMFLVSKTTNPSKNTVPPESKRSKFRLSKRGKKACGVTNKAERGSDQQKKKRTGNREIRAAAGLLKKSEDQLKESGTGRTVDEGRFGGVLWDKRKWESPIRERRC